MNRNIPKPRQIACVIRIISETALIINTGKDNLKAGDKVQIYELGDVITDLDNNPLGYYIYIKDVLNVVQVEDNFSICRKKEIVKKPNVFNVALSPMLEETYTKYIPLKIDKAEINPLSEIDLTIHIGDAVKLA